MPIKFFIQKDIPKEVQAEVCENIAVSATSSLTWVGSERVFFCRRWVVGWKGKFLAQDMCSFTQEHPKKSD